MINGVLQFYLLALKIAIYVAMAGQIKNLTLVVYSPGPAGSFKQIDFSQCEASHPGATCDYKLAKTFNLNPVVATQSWPIGVFNAIAADGSSVSVTVAKKDGVDAEYEGSVIMVLAGVENAWIYDLACNTLE